MKKLENKHRVRRQAARVLAKTARILPETAQRIASTLAGSAPSLSGPINGSYPPVLISDGEYLDPRIIP